MSAAPTQTPSLEVESSDVLRLILQYLRENNLHETARTLQDEAQVVLNTVDNLDVFISDINNGHWDTVLQTVSSLKLPPTKLIDLYEQIALELAEMRERETARSLIRQTAPMQLLREGDPERHAHLERVVQAATFDAREAYGGTAKERRRAAVARALSGEVAVVQPGRLLALVGQALKWQQHQGLLPPGTKFDVFRGSASYTSGAAGAETSERCPREVERTMKMGKKSHCEAARFAPDGQHLATGSLDGFVELWDFTAGRVDRGLKFQADDEFMVHDAPVLCIAWSRDSDALATGSQDGVLKVWQARTGKLLRKIERAHDQGLTCAAFSRDGTQLLTGSFDQTARVHGLNSGRTIKVFRGHTSFVNDVCYAQSGAWVVSGSSDGTVRIWDARSSDCLDVLRPAQFLANVLAGRPDTPVISVALASPREGAASSEQQLVIGTKSDTVALVTLKGQLVKTFTAGPGIEFVACCVSAHGGYVFAASQDGLVYCFNSETGRLENTVKTHDGGLVGITAHPHRSLLATYGEDGTLKTWHP
eukprot:m51a1_g1251 putative wd40 repeat-containing protein smu1 (535) ;mRNA; r:33501-35375